MTSADIGYQQTSAEPSREPSAPQATPVSDTKSRLMRRLLHGRALDQRIPKRQETEPLQLSLAQERLWFLEQLTPGTAMNNVAGAMILNGELNVTALREALSLLVARHDTLRTRFVSEKGEPCPVIGSEPEFSWSETDAEGDQDDDIDADLQQWAAAPFDLEHGPLLRACLYRLGGNRFILAMAIHHIACDGWSLQVITRDLAIFYGAKTNSTHPLPPTLTLSYYDYAIWQRRHLDHPQLRKQLDYWREQFLHLPPSAYPWRDGTGDTTAAGGQESALLSPEIAGKIATFARETRTTPFMITLAAFKAVLHRMAGETDICINTPIANRGRPETEHHVGFFVNMLPLRTDLSDDPSFVKLVEKEKAVVLSAFANSDMPFEAIVKEVRPEWATVWRSLVQIAFAYHQQFATPSVKISGITVEPKPLFAGAAAFDLMLSLHEGEDGLRVTLDFSGDVMSAETARTLLSSYSSFLEDGLASSHQTISRVRLLSAGQQSEVVKKGRRETSFIVGDTLHAAVARQAKQNPHAPALSFDSAMVSYGELERRAENIARRLRAKGVRSEAKVGLCLTRSPELIIAMLGILKAGAAYVPLDPAYPPERLDLLVHLARPEIIITRQGLMHDTGIMLFIDDMTEDDLPAGTMAGDNRPIIYPDNAAYVIFTSGSTGTPKGVVVTHANVMRLLDATRPLFSPDHHDVWSMFHSASFDFSVWEIWGALLTGGRVAILDTETSRDPIALCTRLHAERVTILSQTPSAFRSFIPAALQGGIPESLRLVIFGGEALDRRILTPWFERFGDQRPKPVNMYGITETTVHATHEVISQQSISRQGANSIVGMPLADLDIFLVDQHGLAVADGMPGEILVGGAGLSRGYLDDPALTAERFVCSDLASPGERLYRSGDLARRLPDGRLSYLGRIDQQLKLRGFRIEPGEVEACLRRHPHVMDAVVRTVERNDGDLGLVAYVVSRPAEIDETERRNIVAAYRNVFDDTYRPDEAEISNADFDISGWVHSGSGLKMSFEEMREWADATLNRLVGLPGKHVLEIGCGMGLLLDLAKFFETYTGTDISEVALRHVRHLAERRNLENVRLEWREAENFEGIGRGDFDLVVLNSIIQYFPDPVYLTRVLDQAKRAMNEAGTIFVGDVPDLRLLPALYAGILCRELDPSTTSSYASQLLRQAIDNVREIRATPAFFHDHCRTRGAWADVQIKRGRHHNEMTCFRYDVIMYPGRSTMIQPEWLCAWSTVGSIEALVQTVSAQRPATFAVLSVPNNRVYVDTLLATWLLSPSIDTAETLDMMVTKARHAANEIGAIDPEQIWAIGLQLGYSIRIAPSPVTPALIDVMATHEDAADFDYPWQLPEMVVAEQTEPVICNPLATATERSILADIQTFLRMNLPAHLLPDFIIPLSRIPLTANGKLDITALPSPRNHATFTETKGRAPETGEETRLAEIWCRLLGLKAVSADDDFWDLGGHSLIAARLMFEVSSAFGIHVPLMTLFRNSTLAGMAATITRAMSAYETALPAARANAEESEAYWRQEAHLPADFSVHVGGKPGRGLFVTGATGFLGAYLAKEALQDDAFDTVFCLVRAGDDAEAAIRLRQTLMDHDLWEDKHARRLHAVAGDLGHDRLGMTPERFQEMAISVGTILHAGCRVNFAEPYSLLRAANVEGTRRLLHFASTGSTKPFHHVSSLGVFDDGDMTAAHVLMEDRVPGFPQTLDDAYSQTKWVSEEMIREAGRQGLPYTILRPGRIGGHSITGDCPPDDLLWLVVRASIVAGALPSLDLPLDVSPVDYVARTIMAIARGSGASGTAYHLNNVMPARFADMQTWLKQAGYSLPLLAYDRWRSLVFDALLSSDTETSGKDLLRLLPLLSPNSPDFLKAAREARADNRNARMIVNALSLPCCPPIDGSMVTRFLSSLQARGKLATPMSNTSYFQGSLQ
ncbi:amino acid adenylation domain-containing protein/thioester reductase-like protein [Neorhizobium huautlense]|uniref:Amino acid adenylation domain-containing protein/thioester reductase-like protein n=1 Tax=Neorhizobium huautlense TaxID=67774 RepID=A0ABT9PV86_9HYPH|nr:non-ribosomal peptide synthetase [Neorhizobium huautlense]MDP9838378.1 amino acid adenylation domain-containing protein/thioester reductase-like protein [Neorhizobium huautlense]